MPKTTPKPVHFDATVVAAGAHLIARLPEAASKQLPSRGQVAVRGSINDRAFETVVEPDGTFGHWIRIDKALAKAAKVGAGHTVTVAIAPTDTWPEPTVPADLKRALASATDDVRELWKAVTPMARWEWVRWVNETKNPATRTKRIDVTLSKLAAGKRRPCCFNLASCTDPELARSGKLALDEPGARARGR